MATEYLEKGASCFTKITGDGKEMNEKVKMVFNSEEKVKIKHAFPKEKRDVHVLLLVVARLSTFLSAFVLRLSALSASAVPIHELSAPLYTVLMLVPGLSASPSSSAVPVPGSSTLLSLSAVLLFGLSALSSLSAVVMPGLSACLSLFAVPVPKLSTPLILSAVPVPGSSTSPFLSAVPVPGLSASLSLFAMSVSYPLLFLI